VLTGACGLHDPFTGTRVTRPVNWTGFAALISGGRSAELDRGRNILRRGNSHEH